MFLDIKAFVHLIATILALLNKSIDLTNIREADDKNTFLFPNKVT